MKTFLTASLPAPLLRKIIISIAFLSSAIANADTTVSSSALNSEKLSVNHSQDALLAKLAINEGKGQFTQRKYFKFLSMPITSSGIFIVREKTALWQTQQPVFSQLLLTSEAIYQRQAQTDNFQTLINNGDFSAVLATIFTGKVSRQNWIFTKGLTKESTAQTDKEIDVENNKSTNCLVLMPKSEQLQAVFSQVELCLVNDSKATENIEQKREITLLDKQGNKTEITMQISNDRLSSEDTASLTVLTQQAFGKNSQAVSTEKLSNQKLPSKKMSSQKVLSLKVIGKP